MVFEGPKWNRDTYLRVENESFLGTRKPSTFALLKTHAAFTPLTRPIPLHEIRKEHGTMTISFEK